MKALPLLNVMLFINPKNGSVCSLSMDHQL